MALSRLGRFALAAISLLLVSAVLAGPAHGQTDETQPTEAPTTEAPPDTEAPTDTEAPDTDTTSTTGEDPADNDNVGVVVLLIVLGIALAALIGALVGRSGNSGAQQQASAAPSPQRDLLSNVRWLHDQLSVQLMSGAPDVAAQQWATNRPRVQNMATAANQYSSGAGGGAWQRLSQAITDTAAALDHSTAIRTDATASADATSQAANSVAENRSILMQAAEVAARTVD